MLNEINYKTHKMYLQNFTNIFFGGPETSGHHKIIY